MPRKDLPWPLFLLAVAMELYTSTAVIYLQAGVDRDVTYILYVFLTIVRFAVWSFTSWYLVRDWKVMAHYYFLIDKIFAFAGCAWMAYVFVNMESESNWMIAACVGYAVLLFSLTGHYRIMVHCHKWTTVKGTLYKLNRAYAVFFYMAIGLSTLKHPPATLDKDIYLTFLFVTLAYLTELDGEGMYEDEEGEEHGHGHGHGHADEAHTGTLMEPLAAKGDAVPAVSEDHHGHAHGAEGHDHGHS